MTAGQKEALEQHWPIYGIDQPDRPLDLIETFGRDEQRVVEIGFGDGENLIHQVVEHPQVDYLGVEVYRNGVGRVLRGADLAGATNLRVCCTDAVDVLKEWLTPASVDEVWVYFPDPWHKKRHHKRRLVQSPFCDLVARVLKPGGTFRLATDWENYAEQMLEVLTQHPDFSEYTDDVKDQKRIETRFQRRGERLGHGVWDFAYTRLSV